VDRELWDNGVAQCMGRALWEGGIAQWVEHYGIAR